MIVSVFKGRKYNIMYENIIINQLTPISILKYDNKYGSNAVVRRVASNVILKMAAEIVKCCRFIKFCKMCDSLKPSVTDVRWTDFFLLIKFISLKLTFTYYQ